ncbi:hypothetical protein FACS1894168_3400 [Deltaproteobacteria bacterium]|nr:hypothetical protein FACS1894168_3400 [Deltaproteobacteria bacterium]
MTNQSHANAVEAANELLALSNHLYGRMEEYALLHMEDVARRILEEEGVTGLPKSKTHPNGKNGVNIQKLIDASMKLVEFIYSDHAESDQEYEQAFQKLVKELALTLCLLGLIKIKIGKNKD